MAKKLYYQNELTNEWKEGLEASIKVGKLRNHREKTTQRNDRALALWVALDFQDMGIMRPELLQEESWLELVNRYRNGQTRSKKKITEKSIKKRREGLIQLLEGLGLSLIHISEPTRPLYITYAVFCLKKPPRASVW